MPVERPATPCVPCRGIPVGPEVVAVRGIRLRRASLDFRRQYVLPWRLFGPFYLTGLLTIGNQCGSRLLPFGWGIKRRSWPSRLWRPILWRRLYYGTRSLPGLPSVWLPERLLTPTLKIPMTMLGHWALWPCSLDPKPSWHPTQ